MKRYLGFGLAASLAALAVLGCSDETTTEPAPISPEDLKPPLNLISISGDKSVTLIFESANSTEDELVPTSFAIYMAAAEVSGEPQEIAVEEGVPGEAFAAFDADSAAPGLQPIYVMDAASTTVPGKISITLKDGDTGCVYPPEVAEADDQVAPEKLAPSQATEDTGTDATDGAAEVGPCGANLAAGAAIALANGTAYSFFVTVRVEDNTGESWTSNWVSDTPRAEIEDITLADTASDTNVIANGSSKLAVDLDALLGPDGATAAVLDCVDSGGNAAACTRDNPSGDGNLALLNAPAGADLTVLGFGLGGARPRNLIVTANNATAQDAGYVEDWASIDVAPDSADPNAGYLAGAFPVDVESLGHAYIVATSDGNYAKIRVTSVEPGVSLSFKAAVQDTGRQLKQ